MLGFATNISSILYTTAKFIIQTLKHNYQTNKVTNVPGKDDTRDINIKETTNNDMSFNNQDIFYISLKRRQRIEIPEIEP